MFYVKFSHPRLGGGPGQAPEDVDQKTLAISTTLSLSRVLKVEARSPSTLAPWVTDSSEIMQERPAWEDGWVDRELNLQRLRQVCSGQGRYLNVGDLAEWSSAGVCELWPNTCFHI